jgi:hypothetical protein
MTNKYYQDTFEEYDYIYDRVKTNSKKNKKKIYTSKHVRIQQSKIK